MATQKDPKKVENTKTPANLPHYDAHLIPAETVAREAREGRRFGQVEHDSANNTEHIHTRDGYTVDQEGLINNYAVEAPMYVSEPGDLAEEEAAAAQQKAADLKSLSKDTNGNLSPDINWQHKGPGII